MRLLQFVLAGLLLCGGAAHGLAAGADLLAYAAVIAGTLIALALFLGQLRA